MVKPAVLSVNTTSLPKFIDIFVHPIKQAYYRLFPKDLTFTKSENGIRHFRSFINITASKEGVNKEGSYESISGSGQFNRSTLPILIEKIKNIFYSRNLVIVDLREEPHGFVNGDPVHWKIDSRKAHESEESFLSGLPKFFLKWRKLFVFIYVPIPVAASETSTEEQAIKKLKNKNIEYLRLPITDHCKPSNTVTDQIVKLFFEYSAKSTWLHFHCAVGKGRTTTAMAMCDIMRNAGKLSLDEILHRQHLIGGEDLRLFRKKKFTENARERFEFLENFYRYCKLVDINTQTWTQWIERQPPSERQV